LVVGVEVSPSEAEEVEKIARQKRVNFKKRESPFDPEKILIEIVTIGPRADRFFESFWERNSKKSKNAQEIIPYS